MRSLIWLVALSACTARPEPKLPIEWAPSFHGGDLVLSAGGEAVAVADGEIVRLHAHDPGQRLLGKGLGTLVGAPSHRDALLLDSTNTLRWLVATRSLALPLEDTLRWTFAGGAVDHAATRAQLVFVPYARFDRAVPAGYQRKLRILAIDTAAMRVIGKRDVELDGRAARDPGQRFGQPDPAVGRDADDAEWIFEPGCTVTGAAAMFLTCHTSAGRGDHDSWAITRYDNLAPAWSSIVSFVDDRRGDTAFSALDGAGAAVVIAWGSHWHGAIKLFQSAIVDARTGATRLVQRSEMAGDLYRLLPYPGHRAIAELYLDVTGMMMLDTSRGVATKLFEWPDELADKLTGVGIAVRADGTFVVGSHDPAYRPR